MCHSSAVENEQIEKCIENGMPKKLIKTIKTTMRKRAANEGTNNKIQKQQSISHQKSNGNNISMKQINPEKSNAYVSKCPFGHGKFSTIAGSFFTSPQTATPTTTTTSMFIDKGFDLANNNNLYERPPQISPSSNFEDGNEQFLFTAEKNAYKYNDDVLAKSVQRTRQFAYGMQQALRNLQRSTIYRVLTKSTQVAHLVAIGIITFVLVTVWPELNDGQNSLKPLQPATTTVPRQEVSVRKNEILALIAYLATFSIHFGAQIWMTFVSGLSLYFSLPRHIFGQCQQILFPKYFAINAVLSTTMLILYVKYIVNTWTLSKWIQLGSLSLTAVIELSVRLYLAPPLLRLMHEKYKIEGTIGSGKEVGSLLQGDLIRCPHYQHINKSFRRIHMITAIGNIITMAGSCLQLYNIAVSANSAIQSSPLIL